MLRRKNDILLKSAFEEYFHGLLRFFFKNADEIFDMKRGFEFMDKELLEIMPETTRKGGTRHVDMLVKAWLLDGTEEWILVHIEIQGQNTQGFAKRMFTYYYRVLDRFNVNITALAIFTGNKWQQQPNAYNKDFLGTELSYKYNVYHILDHTEQELLAMANPFALVVLAAQKALLAGKIPEEELAEHRLTIIKALIQSKQYDGETIQRFLFFLKNFLHISKPEINITFDKKVDLLTGKTHVMGIVETIKELAREEGLEEGRELGREQGLEQGLEQGIEKGIEKGRRETLAEAEAKISSHNETVVMNLLEKLGLSDEQAASIASVSVAFVKNVRLRLESK